MPVEGPSIRRARAVPHLIVAVLIAALVAPEAAQAADVPEKPSPPGQVYVWTANARQQLAVDLKAFRRLYELVKAVRDRPSAFDGGVSDGTGMPDVMIFNEMRFANLEIFRRLLLQRSKYQYEIVSAEGAEDKFLYNTTTMTQQGTPQTIVDPCRSGDDGARQYLVARFTENATNTPVTVAGVHLKARYDETGQPQCRERNIQAIKTALAGDVGPVVVGGDFNKRPVEVEGACDPNEQSPPLEWYSMMTNPADLSRAYVDASREYHRDRNDTMEDEWTFERLTETKLCNDEITFKRSRLDYLFAAGVTVAEAHADHPGWADDVPGGVPFGKERYSDHRWVWGRFIVTGPARPNRPTADLAAGGAVQITWEPVEGATSYVVYRAKRWHSFADIATVPADQVTYLDSAKHGISYKYAVAAVGADGGQGRESLGRKAIPDARGPRVSATDPPDGAAGVHRKSKIRVWFDEGVDPDSIDEKTIEVFRSGRKVHGRVRRVSGRQISFNPNRLLKRGVDSRSSCGPSGMG